MLCKEHPTYHAIRAPKRDCEVCKAIWFSKNDPVRKRDIKELQLLSTERAGKYSALYREALKRGLVTVVSKEDLESRRVLKPDKLTEHLLSMLCRPTDESDLEQAGPLCGRPRPENYDNMSSEERLDYYCGEGDGKVKED